MPRGVWVCVCAVAAVAPFGAPAQASFPGVNGKIALSEGNEIFTMNPDGSGGQRFLALPPNRNDPAWSPDGAKMAYRRGVPQAPPTIAIVNADGTGDHELSPDPRFEADPAWSPDGTKIAYVRYDSANNIGDIYVIDAAGGSPTQVTFGAEAEHPSWSPDGKRIAFSARYGQTWWDIWTMDPDGTEIVNLTDTPDIWEIGPDWSPDASRIAFGQVHAPQVVRVMDADGSDDTPLVAAQGVKSPTWSPDGTKIAYDNSGDIYVMNADGSGSTLVRRRHNSSGGEGMSWQPIPVNAYPRPRGATPVQVSMVPAYSQCAAPDRTHGPPLAFQSCDPPVQVSGELTVGTADANGKPTKSRGTVRYDAIAGVPATPADEADVRLTVDVFDVYAQGSLADYAGALEAHTSLRITDKVNTPHPGGPGAGTVTDISLSASVPCTATPDPTEGGGCNLFTTFDALVPGTVTEARRSIWELGAAELYDGNGELFMTQGLFVP